jgi:3' terminal RNA ribose 2'-O-methyltransferase Hen1
MLLTITSTHAPATDLGYLLHKNPGRVQSFPQSFGQAHVFYPEASEERCTAALLLDVDPVELARGRDGRVGARGALEPYVNDRPYVASSFLSVAIADVFGTALAGRSRERPELAKTALPLVATLAVVPARGGEKLLRRLFEPLGYRVDVEGQPLDEQFPQWGASRYFRAALAATCRLRELLTHLYVLVPVLDDEKHYWVDEAEVDKLLRHGGDWLAAHPERELIADRYLKHRRVLTRAALTRLLEEDQPDPDDVATCSGAEEETVEAPLRLSEPRLGAVIAALKQCAAQRVLDLGCGEGRLLRELAHDAGFTRVVGLDASHRALQIARERLERQRLPPRANERVELLQGALTYRDTRLEGFDAAVVAEVIEHLDLPRLAAFERVLFGYARPHTVVVTTPNVEYNVRFRTLPAGQLRHRDHRFEWTRAEFQTWASGVAARAGYAVRFLPIGPEDPELGAPTQMGVFRREADHS